MELWIRSQNRLGLVKTTDVCINYNNQKSIIANFRNLGNGDDDYFPLGEYDTEERALEVLDEIQRLIKPTFKINYEFDDSQPIIDGKWLKSLKAESKIQELSCYVYEMPKE